MPEIPGLGKLRSENQYLVSTGAGGCNQGHKPVTELMSLLSIYSLLANT